MIFQAALANVNPRAANKLDFHNGDRRPLLVIGNDQDHTVPASVSKEAAKRLGKSKAVVDYKEFAGRPYFAGHPAGRRSPTTRSTGPTATPARPRRASKQRYLPVAAMRPVTGYRSSEPVDAATGAWGRVARQRAAGSHGARAVALVNVRRLPCGCIVGVALASR